MKKTLTTSFFLIGITCILCGQASGYLGKRSLGRLSLNLAPAIAYGFSEGLWGPNARLGLQWEQVLSRQFSGGVAVYGLSNVVRYDDRNAPMGAGVGLARVNALAGSISLRAYQFWRRGNLAPIGPYQEVELLFIRYNIRDLDGRYPPGGIRDLGQFSDMGITITLGTQRVYRKKICVDMGAQVGTLAGILGTSFRRDASPHDLGTARLVRHFSLTGRIAIGGIFSFTKR